MRVCSLCNVTFPLYCRPTVLFARVEPAPPDCTPSYREHFSAERVPVAPTPHPGRASPASQRPQPAHGKLLLHRHYEIRPRQQRQVEISSERGHTSPPLGSTLKDTPNRTLGKLGLITPSMFGASWFHGTFTWWCKICQACWRCSFIP